VVALEQCNLIAWQRAKANWLNRCLADPEVFGSDPHCRRAIAPTSTRRPAPLNRIIVAITRDALVLQAEIARLSFPQPAIGGPSLIVPREKLARETEPARAGARNGGGRPGRRARYGIADRGSS